MKKVRPKSDAQAAKQIYSRYSHPAIFATKHLCFSSCLFGTNSQTNKPGPQNLAMLNPIKDPLAIQPLWKITMFKNTMVYDLQIVHFPYLP